MTLNFLEAFKLKVLEMVPIVTEHTPRRYLWETDSMFAKKVAIFNKYGYPSAEYALVRQQSRQYKSDKHWYDETKKSLQRAHYDLP